MGKAPQLLPSSHHGKRLSKMFIQIFTFNLIPQLLVIATYLISSAFMSVYHMAVDTIFICACKILRNELNFFPLTEGLGC